jgi:hypothetical protein
MSENHDTDHGKKRSDRKVSDDIDENADVIELSDIAIGTSQEDDAIIELTEELIGEAMDGITGATHEDFSEEEHIIDLSHDPAAASASFYQQELQEKHDLGPVVDTFSGEIEIEAADVEDHFEKELDDFFGKEMEQPLKPSREPEGRPGAGDRATVAVTSEKELLAALEIMIRNKYGDRIHHMLVAAIDKIVLEEFERIKKILLKL